MQKARSQARTYPKVRPALLPLVSMWFQDLFHSPPRGAFHLSLTVLVHYRSHGSIKPWRVVPPASRPTTRNGRYSGTPLRHATGVAYRAVTVSGAPFQGTSAAAACRVRGSYNPEASEDPSVWAVPGSLAATTGISVDFSSSGY